MTVQTTSNLSDSLKAEYVVDYIKAARMVRLYDNLAFPIGSDMSRLAKGTSIVIPIIGDMEPGTTAISESADVVPSVVEDTTVSVTPTSRWGATQCSEKLLNTTYTPYGSEKFAMIGKNQMETVDVLASNVACAGNLWRSYAMTARASLDAGTGYYLTSTVFQKIAAELQALKVPGFIDEGREMWSCLTHPFSMVDFLASTDILAVGEYQKANIVLGQEIGEFGKFKIAASPWNKVFWGGGTANGTPIETTLSAASSALATSITMTDVSNVTVGDRLMLGTKEGSSTHYATNETCIVTTAPVGYVVGVTGEAANGGLRFTHANGTTVSNDDNVCATVFGGPKSLVKVWDTNMDNEYGTIVGPKKQGLLDQFESLGWKFYGNYGRPIESRIFRYEHTFSLDA
jgi:hypothetical protein